MASQVRMKIVQTNRTPAMPLIILATHQQILKWMHFTVVPCEKTQSQEFVTTPGFTLLHEKY